MIRPRFLKTTDSPTKNSAPGSALVLVMIFLVVISVSLMAVHSYTNAVGRQTAGDTEYLRENAAAEAAIEEVVGRMIQWVTANNGYGPSIADCQTTSMPGNPTFSTINSAITFPSSSKLSDFTVTNPVVYPVLPDDTVVTDPANAQYLPNVAQRLSISENSNNSVTRYYFTHSATLNAKNVPARSMTYQITLTVTPKVKTLISPNPITITRYLRCDKINPFQWCTYRGGSANYYGGTTYTGPLYLANNVNFFGPTYTDSVLYGGAATNYYSSFTGGGYAAQVKQTSLLSLVPNLVNNLAVDSNGNRQASSESNNTPSSSGGPAPADMFSTRELIEPPTNPSNDNSPSVFKNARIYNQADIRIKVLVTTSGSTKTVSTSLVNVDGSTISASGNPWVTQVLNAVNVNVGSGGQTAFYDRSRSTTAIESTDINVGALGTVMAAYPSVFPTGIIYAYDATGLSGSTARPLTGVRLWNGGVLPNGGLVVGSNDPIYIKGDFNTGTTLPGNATVNTAPTNGPASNFLGRNSTSTTEAQRTTSSYTIQPAGVFGDAVIELSNAWNDANSLSTGYASSTTINLVEGWSTMSANELNSNDTYLDPAGRANPMWIEDWSGARRTMSGEEMVVWHSKYCTTTNEYFGGNWVGDISYDSNVTNLKLNWGVVNFVRDRKFRQ